MTVYSRRGKEQCRNDCYLLELTNSSPGGKICSREVCSQVSLYSDAKMCFSPPTVTDRMVRPGLTSAPRTAWQRKEKRKRKGNVYITTTRKEPREKNRRNEGTCQVELIVNRSVVRAKEIKKLKSFYVLWSGGWHHWSQFFVALKEQLRFL